MMLFHNDRKPLTYHPRTISVLVLQLALTHLCRGQSKLIGSSQPIMATLGEDITLPCQLEPKKDASGLTLEWTRPDLNPRFVHVWRSGEELVGKKHQSFEGRTSLFIDELKNGNISLKLSKVKLSDDGIYRCFIPALEQESFVQLVIASNATSLPVVTLAGLDECSSGVMLQCESKGWYPEPEVLWLDGEGHVLSAGPTETARGPDDLYTVSSRVTVDKRHGNRFTCRVQQTNINQTRETHIEVTDDFLNVQSSISSATVGLAVSLAVCVLFILLLVFILWKKQNIIKFIFTESKKRQWDEDDEGQRKISLKPGKTKDQVFIEEERERETLIADKTEQMEEMDRKKKTRHLKNQTPKKHQKKEEAEITVKKLEEELETKRTEVEKKESELQQLHVENQEREKNLQTVKDKLEDKNKELQTVKAQIDKQWFPSFSKEKMMKVEKEVETLKKQLETMETESHTKITEIKDKQADVQQLKDEIQRMETNLQMENDKSNKTKSGRSRAAPVQPSSLLEGNVKEETQRREEAEREVETLKNQLEENNKQSEGNQTETNKKLQEETQNREETESEVERLKNQLEQMKINQQSADDKWKERLEQSQYELQQTKRHTNGLLADNKRLTEEKKTSESERQLLQKELETLKQEVFAMDSDGHREYICLRNLSHKDQHLGGWELKLHVNYKNPIIFKFDSSFSLKAQGSINLWVPESLPSNSATDLVWKDLKTWRLGDKLQYSLVKSTPSA